VIPFKLIANTPIAGDDYSKNSKIPESVEKIIKNYN
jgi:hypothetical protein